MKSGSAARSRTRFVSPPSPNSLRQARRSSAAPGRGRGRPEPRRLATRSDREGQVGACRAARGGPGRREAAASGNRSLQAGARSGGRALRGPAADRRRRGGSSLRSRHCCRVRPRRAAARLIHRRPCCGTRPRAGSPSTRPPGIWPTRSVDVPSCSATTPTPSAIARWLPTSSASTEHWGGKCRSSRRLGR